MRRHAFMRQGRNRRAHRVAIDAKAFGQLAFRWQPAVVVNQAIGQARADSIGDLSPKCDADAALQTGSLHFFNSLSTRCHAVVIKTRYEKISCLFVYINRQILEPT